MAKTVLITGAARRVGKAMAFHLACQGWDVAIHYNTSVEEAILFKAQLETSYPKQKFEIFKADLNRTEEVEMLLRQVVLTMGTLDLLINNASLFESAWLGQTTTAFLDHHMNINFKAPLILTRNFAQQIKHGTIINFVDTRIVNNQSRFAAYSLSKKALWELTKMAALEFGPNIRVNAIAPGLTLAPEEKEEAYLWNLAKNITMKRPGGLTPILKSLDFILENEYLTGQLLFCDGGENLGLKN